MTKITVLATLTVLAPFSAVAENTSSSREN